MGNIGSNGHSRRRHGNHNNNTHPHPQPPPSQPPQPDISGNRYVYGGGGSGGGTTPYPGQYPNTNPPQYNQYYGYYQQPPGPMPVPMQNPYDHHHHHGGGGNPHVNPAHGNWGGGQFPGPPGPQFATPYIEHQKATTIRNNVNLKKETLRVEPDEENPGHFLISFTFDATVAGSITIIFFAKEGEDCNLMPTKEPLLEPITVSFQPGLGQKFRQPSGTGIDFSVFEETDLLKEGDMEVFPLAVKAEALPLDQNGSEGENQIPGNVSSQITEAVFEKERGGYQVRVMKQILWVNGSRYELQEIYGIGSAVESELDESDQGKDCVICLSEPRDTTVLPCRHMCMCSACAKVLRFQTDRCPICRQPVERLLEIKVNNRPED